MIARTYIAKGVLGVCLGLLLCVGCTPIAHAQEVVLDETEVVKAEVVDVVNEEARTIPGTDAVGTFQTLRAQILEGTQKGDVVTVENDYLGLKEGETFYLRHTVSMYDGKDYYSVLEPYRLPTLALFGILFLVVVFVFGGVQGIRGLAALAGSLLLIFYVLLPAILAGHSPILMSVIVASLIVTLGSYITHGFTKTTSTAVLGMIVTVVITGLLAYFSVDLARLSGFSAEEAVALNFNTRGSIDFIGLLMGSILIGLLGVLYDAAIGQAVSVEELHRVAPHTPRKTIYTRALRIGREHIGALVNTLAIAYVGASLPLLLLFYTTGSDPYMLINQEIIAAEIVRTVIGSIGVILVVPITTLVATYILVPKQPEQLPPELEKTENEALAAHHTHSH